MRLRVVTALLAVYAVTAAAESPPGESRVILQPATRDAVEVYYQLASPRYELRRRLARNYGGRVALEWNPFDGPWTNL
ncbi:hypothetical protein ABZ297_22810 [Nonomuraea sp. NPDC005983]|uniref:hypothetical protein n=1 Tax=Nonomuraea sp. NPDC005983 TaxID=3155595 RepID=UPI0033B07A17